MYVLATPNHLRLTLMSVLSVWAKKSNGILLCQEFPWESIRSEIMGAEVVLKREMGWFGL